MFSDEISSYIGSKTECDVQDHGEHDVLESEDAEENAVSEDDCTGDVQEDDINLQNIVDTIGNIEVETDLSIDHIAYERNELTEIEQTENDDNEQTEYDDLPDLEQSMEILSLIWK